ncbi:MAG: phosphotransferase [Bacteroidales bacterium]|nr:phosphotransferase [Bacteroidales bacterium]
MEPKHIREQLLALCASSMHLYDLQVESLPAEGSNRRYFRLIPPSAPALIGTYGPNLRENEAFIYLSRHFASARLPVPHIYAVSSCGHFYIQRDLGRTALLDVLVHPERHGGLSPMELAQQAISQLVQFQVEGAKGLDISKLYPVPQMDERSVMWDLNYFKYCFLRIAMPEIDEVALEADFERMAQQLLSSQMPLGFQYRDFQARNIVLQPNGELAFIDYQGGRMGPGLYDVASFLFQAKAGFSPDERSHLLERYLDTLAQRLPINRDAMLQHFPMVAAFRVIQTLGTYGFRGYVQRKPHFMQSMPLALRNLQHLALSPHLDAVPYIKGIALALDTSPLVLHHRADNELVDVYISSVSLKKGYPTPDAEHGGGFIFDCRALPNPGRIEALRGQTGLDPEVVGYMERQPQVDEFMKHVEHLVAMAIDNYKSRHFTYISVAFGCTGGQHRSVYCANRLFNSLKQVDGVKLHLHHCELSKM